MKTERKTLDQQVASAALLYLNETFNYSGTLTKEQKDILKSMSTACKKTSSRILTSGLIPAIAFCANKKGKDSEEKYQFIAAEGLRKFLALKGADNVVKLAEILIDSGSTTLRFETERSLAYLTWLARLAEGRSKQDRT